MRERGILYSAPMVRAKLAGIKTQTRRLVKNPDWLGCTTGDCPHSKQTDCDAAMASHCPYGKVGDRLWGREAFRIFLGGNDDRIEYRAGGVREVESKEWPKLLDGCTIGGVPNTPAAVKRSEREFAGENVPPLWHPSIHMPRTFSRILDEIVEIRVQRVQDISAMDAIVEGNEINTDDGVTYYGPLDNGDACPIRAYAKLWDSINGKGSWESNPWVFAITTRPVKL